MEKSKKNSGWKHRLSNVNLESMTADCAHCGPNTAISQRDKIRCWNGRQKGGTYGDTKLTYEQKRSLFTSTHCPICTREISYETAVLDHCHQSNKIRGFLCSDCNLGLGKFRDDVASLERAIEYLNGNRGRLDDDIYMEKANEALKGAENI